MTWNVDGKTILITGATNGIGLEAAVELSRRGARVALVGRDRSKLDAALTRVKTESGREPSSYLCDFSSQASIRALAADILVKEPRIDVLVNNAGGVHKDRTLTVDGIEATFATNHLGYFLLTNLLLDRLVASAPARIVTVASVGHRRGTLDFDDLGFERGYAIFAAYARSKLANILFANELAVRLADKNVTSNSLHPGAVATNIWSGAPGWSKPIITLLFRPFFISAKKGSDTIVHLAASPDVDGASGVYFEKNRPVTPSTLAQDKALGRRLWDVSAKLVGLSTPTS